MLRQRLWKFPGPFFSWCYCLCPEFALPLSIWASSGWIGLPLHWRAELNEACPSERVTTELSPIGLVP